MAKQVLGRGMSAILEVDAAVIPGGGSASINDLRMEEIHPNPNQPRDYFDEEKIAELSASIKAVGITTPITVRKMNDGSYQIIAGERRYKAAKKAGLDKIPAYIKIIEDEQVMLMAMVENIQREDLNAIEEAKGYQYLIKELQKTQEEISELVGKNRSTVGNYLRLLKLPAVVQNGIQNRLIDMGHARALLSIEETDSLIDTYNQIIEHGYTVRMVEEIARQIAKEAKAEQSNEEIKKEKTSKTPKIEHEEVKQRLSSRLNAQVDFVCNKKGKGKITIPFANEEEMKRLLELLNAQ
jgi:ParB family chromosome partitioning protein